MSFSFPSIIGPALIIILVVVINVALFSMLRSRNTRDQIEILRKAGKSARNPWKSEDERLEELSEKVSQLQKSRKSSSSGISKDKEE